MENHINLTRRINAQKYPQPVCTQIQTNNYVKSENNKVQKEIFVGHGINNLYTHYIHIHTRDLFVLLAYYHKNVQIIFPFIEMR